MEEDSGQINLAIIKDTSVEAISTITIRSSSESCEIDEIHEENNSVKPVAELSSHCNEETTLSVTNTAKSPEEEETPIDLCKDNNKKNLKNESQDIQTEARETKSSGESEKSSIVTVRESNVNCDNTELQQVSEKFLALSERLKLTRRQHFETGRLTQTATEPKSLVVKVQAQNTRRTTKSKSTTSNQVAASGKGLGEPNSANSVSSAKQLEKMHRKLSAQKSRQQLEAEVGALHKLLKQLSLENPQICSRISTIAQSMPELKHIDILSLPMLRQEGGCDYQDDQRASTSRGNNTSTNYFSGTPNRPHLDSVGELICNGDDAMDKSKRRRGKRGGKKRNNSVRQKCQVNELQDLVKYINNIVSEYLLKTESVEITAPKFDGGFGDLEKYAGQLVQLGLGRIVEDELRVNRKNNRQSFITMSTDRETLERDGMIMIPVARRYAFEGDIVRAFVLNTSMSSDNCNDKSNEKPPSANVTKDNEDLCAVEDALYEDIDSPDSDLDSNGLLDTTGPIMVLNCPKAFVIEILKHTDDRKAVGSISFKHSTKLSDDDDRLYYKFRPLDTRMPLMYVPESVGLVHANAAKERNEITDLLYLAQICETDVNGHCIAELLELVGKVGHLEHELKAILLHNGLKDIKPYAQRFCDLYSDPSMPTLTSTELKQREDLRKKCIFTIDPPTARDLDDALSVDKVGDDEYEVGVHIADVAYFLDEDSELDEIVKKRATSIYLVNEVIHMLPPTLCYKCSLLPGEDKLSFSVFWRVTRDGTVLGSPRFTRSIMNSCTKFAYDHAQKFIENPNGQIDIDDFPDVYNGFTIHDLAERVKILNEMARNMRGKRFDNGALSINNPKLRFELDPKTGEPVSYEIEKKLEANNLIEEFMLLANMSVARHIYTCFPKIAILRNHAPPLMTSMKALQEKLSAFGLTFDCSSSKTVYSSMLRICNNAEDFKAMNACLSTLLTKPMARAKYICSEDKTDSDLWHYALSIPIYTHFTSPIRRYPDIMVHRLLAASLNYCPRPKRTPDELHELTQICNIQKFNAKSAGDESIMLYFKRYVKAKQSLTLRAVVFEIHQFLTNVVTVETGHVLSIQYKAQKVIVDTSSVPAFIQISEKGSQQPPLKLKVFSTVDIKLVVRDEKLVAFFVSPDLKQRQINCIEMNKNGLSMGQKGGSNNNGTISSGGTGSNSNKQQTSIRPDQRLYAITQQQQQQQSLHQQMQKNGQQIRKQREKVQQKNRHQAKNRIDSRDAE